MKIDVKEAEKRIIRIGIPRWLYMNSLGISIAAMRREVPFSPKQARKSLRAVKKAMKKYGIKTVAQIEVDTGDTQVSIEI